MKQSETRDMCAVEKTSAGDYFHRLGMTAVVGFALICTVHSAKADCGLARGARPASVRMPMIAGAGNFPEEDHERHGSIVGLWHTIYTSGGSTFSESFKEWHSDGTEFENVNHNPATGSVCVGVWKQVNGREVRLHHLGFLFDAAGAPSGTFVVDETDTLREHGMSYEGNFVFRIYDVNGVYTGKEVSGTIAATRITVP